MAIIVSPNQSQIFAALKAFLVGILPSGVLIIQGQTNRVSEPSAPDYVVMTPLRRERIQTNIDTFTDAVFTGSVADNILTITSVQQGTIGIGSPVFGVGVAAGTSVVSLGTGTGGTGTYTILPGSQTFATGTIAAGTASYQQSIKLTIQIDVHGPNSSDNAEIISTLFRDDFAFQQFLTSGFDVVPLYADDPRQMPFINAEQQYETRYVIDAVLQANQVVSGIPQQFADQLVINLIDAEDFAV